MMVNLRDAVVNHARIRVVIVVNYLKLDADFSSYVTEKSSKFCRFLSSIHNTCTKNSMRLVFFCQKDST